MTRLGAKMTFTEAAEETWYSHQTHISETTVRRTTYRHGRMAEQAARQEVERLKAEAPPSAACPQQLAISADGCLIHLTNGEWREIKGVAIGTFETEWQPGTWEQQVKTTEISYFTRSYRVREFEDYALAELHRRGIDNASTVVAVNDGSEWIQAFIDYHCPLAVRIIDFPHAASYVASAGRAIWGEGTETFKIWFKRATHQMKHKPPQQTIAELHLLRQKARSDEQLVSIERALLYLQTRLTMIDYAHFRHCGYPIGSGAVESGHKVVVQRRFKQAGMRWAEHNVDPLLALRDLLCNKRWDEGWQQIVVRQQQQRQNKRLRTAQEKQPPAPEPITFAALKAAGKLAQDQTPAKRPQKNTGSRRPAEDHPWRNGIWPTKESWRWN
jgi:hypothetical protein